MIVTQHSGSGKANQYFLRGFNLDHGTDFATFYDHMPLNLRSHGHGQGYTDPGFVMPERLESVTYAKGPYHARIGDFSGAGSASMTPVSRLDSSVLQATAGKDGYGRLLGAGSWQVGNGELLLGAEGQVYDGPWTDVSEDVEKLNGIARYRREVAKGALALTGLAYHNTWNSADQIPERAVSEGLIDRLGSIDPTSGGETSRYSLSGSWSHPRWQASAYAIRYRLNLWSNFTYYLDDPVAGDQFEQVDQRWIYGGELVRLDTLRLGRAAYDNAVGLQLGYDDIAKVGLYHTQARQRLDAEYAYTRARFTGDDLDSPDSGNSIPGAVPEVFSAGINLAGRQGWFGSARPRYFSPRPLVESGAIESGGSTAVNLRGGYRWHRWELFGDLLNALDSRDHDIDYFYTSRLPDEAAGGTEDIHFHPLEPRTYRLNLAYRPGG